MGWDAGRAVHGWMDGWCVSGWRLDCFKLWMDGREASGVRTTELMGILGGHFGVEGQSTYLWDGRVWHGTYTLPTPGMAWDAMT
jgi:hypothetical protein